MIGIKNTTADKVKRIPFTSSDTYLDRIFDENSSSFGVLECEICKGQSFEVLRTGNWETSAKCTKCNIYYKVHCG